MDSIFFLARRLFIILNEIDKKIFKIESKSNVVLNKKEQTGKHWYFSKNIVVCWLLCCHIESKSIPYSPTNTETNQTRLQVLMMLLKMREDENDIGRIGLPSKTQPNPGLQLLEGMQRVQKIRSTDLLAPLFANFLPFFFSKLFGKQIQPVLTTAPFDHFIWFLDAIVT